MPEKGQNSRIIRTGNMFCYHGVIRKGIQVGHEAGLTGNPYTSSLCTQCLNQGHAAYSLFSLASHWAHTNADFQSLTSPVFGWLCIYPCSRLRSLHPILLEQFSPPQLPFCPGKADYVPREAISNLSLWVCE